MMPSTHGATDAPSAWVSRFCGRIAPGEALDLACGGGRHARLLAAQGLRVLAVDRDPAALARADGPGIATLRIDLESEDFQWPFAPARFSGIVVTNYLHRPLFPALQESLAPGGMLIVETFAVGNERYGKPSNPAFLLTPGELLRVLAVDMRVVAYEDGLSRTPRPAMVQRVCAVKAGSGAGGAEPVAVPLD